MRKPRLLEVVGLVVFLAFAMALTLSPAMRADEEGDLR